MLPPLSGDNFSKTNPSHSNISESKPLSFPQASAFLQLGAKYEVASLKTEATNYLKKMTPSTLHSFDSLHGAYRKAIDPEDSDGATNAPFSLGRRGLISLLVLLRKHDLTDLLPFAFYWCAQLPQAYLLDSYLRGTLTFDNLKICLSGREKLAAEYSCSVQTAYTRSRSGVLCDKACKNLKFIPTRELGPSWSPLSPFDRTVFAAKLRDIGVCNGCMHKAKQCFEKQRLEIWKARDSFFDI